MAITTTRGFGPADRYIYDFKHCSIEKGWAQVDTPQDASYFGQWINPTKRTIFCYCEGDLMLTTCDTVEDLQTELARIETFNANAFSKRFRNGKAVAIDPGFSDALKDACIATGLTEYLH